MKEDPDFDEFQEEPDPEDFVEIPKMKGYLQQKPTMSSVNPALILFLIFAVLTYLSWTVEYKDLFWLSSEAVFEKKEYWRLVTALCVHADALHLLNNSLFFLIFGSLLYFYYGFLVFPLSTLILGVMTNAITLRFHEASTHLIGASGMVYGMVSMWIVFYMNYDIRYTPHIRLLRVVGVCLILLFPTSFREDVDYISHTVGFAAGIFWGLLWLPFLNVKVSRFYENGNANTLPG